VLAYFYPKKTGAAGAAANFFFGGFTHRLNAQF